MATRIDYQPPPFPCRRPHSEQPFLIKIAAVAAAAFVSLASYNKWGFWGGTLVTLGCTTLLYKFFQQKGSDDARTAPRRPFPGRQQGTSAYPYTPQNEQLGSDSGVWSCSGGPMQQPAAASPTAAPLSRRATTPDGDGQQHVVPGSGQGRSALPTGTRGSGAEWSSLSYFSRSFPIAPQPQTNTVADSNGQRHVVPGSRRQPADEGSPPATGADGRKHVVPGSRRGAD
jgi:hypothetical protein